MDDKELEELQNPDNWDWDNAQRIQVPPEHRRSVVSVSIPRDSFRLIAEAVDRSDERLSEYMRNAAVQRARGEQPRITVRFDPGVMLADRPEMIAQRRRLSARVARSRAYSLS